MSDLGQRSEVYTQSFDAIEADREEDRVDVLGQELGVLRGEIWALQKKLDAVLLPESSKVAEAALSVIPVSQSRLADRLDEVRDLTRIVVALRERVEL